MITWYTQPDRSYSSFYYYNDVSLELVRIRLELDGLATKTDSGDPSAFYHKNRVIGFTTVAYSDEERRKFKVRGGRIVDGDGRVIENEIVEGYYVYDLSTSDGRIVSVHSGSKVIDESEANLPSGITRTHLVKLAKLCMKKREDITIAFSFTSKSELGRAIIQTIERGYGIEEYMAKMNRDSSSESDSTEPPPRRRRRRCTII